MENQDRLYVHLRARVEELQLQRAAYLREHRESTGYRIRGLVSDLDGTLLDTEPLYLDAYNRILSRYGHVYEEALKHRVMGKPEAVGAQMIIDAYDLPFSPHGLLAERDVFMDELFLTTQLLPGAKKVCQHLKHTCGLPTAIATSSYRPALEKKIENNQSLIRLFDTVICGDDERVKYGKPSPDIFLACAQKIGIPPRECLAFEDTPTGTRAALRAGMVVVSIPEKGMDAALFDGAIILNSLEEFEPTAFGLPSF